MSETRLVEEVMELYEKVIEEVNEILFDVKMLSRYLEEIKTQQYKKLKSINIDKSDLEKMLRWDLWDLRLQIEATKEHTEERLASAMKLVMDFIQKHNININIFPNEVDEILDVREKIMSLLPD